MATLAARKVRRAEHISSREAGQEGRSRVETLKERRRESVRVRAGYRVREHVRGELKWARGEGRVGPGRREASLLALMMIL